MNKIIQINKETYKEIEQTIDMIEYNKPARNFTWGFVLEGDEHNGYELYESYLEDVVYPKYNVETRKNLIGKFNEKENAELYIKMYDLLKVVVGYE